MDEKEDLFGQVALKRGFVTREQLRNAVEAQRNRPVGTPRLLGLVMLDEGYIGTAQLIEVLRQVRALTTSRWMRRNAGFGRMSGQAS